MRLFGTHPFLLGLFLLGLCGQTFAEPAGIYGQIPFLRSGDFHEFENTMRKTREEVRGELWNEFGSVLIPLAANGGDLDKVAEVLAKTLVTFDGLYRKHREEVHRGIPLSLEQGLRAAFDRQYTELRLSESARKARFVDVEARPESIVAVDYLAYGSYSVSRKGGVAATLTLRNLRSGETRNFSATGPVSRVSALLARQLFAHFQMVAYPDWVNPNPALEWIAPPIPIAPTTATIARRYCEGQGARLPYTHELIQASFGTEYREGGIPPLIPNATYIVADKQRANAQYYFHGTETRAASPLGPVDQGALYAANYAYFWCVRGEVSAKINLTESVYRLIRKLQAANEAPEALAALEYLLVQMDEFGARKYKRYPFADEDAALNVLEKAGYSIRFPR